MKLGMTGNRNGISKHALFKLQEFIKSNDITEAHHGDCIGADTDFHNFCKLSNIPIVIHPPSINSQRSFCKDSVTTKEPKPYLTRNHNIVNESDILIAFPSTKEEVLRSGTWSTIRYAIKRNKIIVIVFPDGEVKNIP